MHFSDVVAVLELRETDFGLSEEVVHQHMPHAEIEHITKAKMTDLDGRFNVILCQTPILPLEFLDKSLIVAQQYSLAKEAYQYGAWRAHAHLNLMYGRYSLEKVNGFSNAVAVGNPLFDTYFEQQPSRGRLSPEESARPQILYLPTYGQLSSISSILPRLGEIDADVTVKLHHMQDRNEIPDVPGRVKVVYSDSDPIDLFRGSDAVISDFSGAAFDAIYAGLPVIFTGNADPLADDYHRLSIEEREAHALAEVTAPWLQGGDFNESLGLARERTDTPKRKALLDEYFVNPGAAGAACAERILDLIRDGEPSHFGARQIRDATKRYIVTNRELRSRISRLRNIEPKGSASPIPERTVHNFGQSGYRRLRQLLARSRSIKRLVSTLRRDKQRTISALSAPLLPVAPRECREAIWEILAPHLIDSGVSVARENSLPGADVAVLDTDLQALHTAFHNVAKVRPDLKIRVNLGKQTIQSASIGSVKLAELRDGHWFQIGISQDIGTYRLGLDGHLSILTVHQDIDRSRYLALYGRAKRVDWTNAFDDVSQTITQQVSSDLIDAATPHSTAPIDVVYTWVDSTDSEWRKQHSYYSNDHVPLNESANNSERYIDREELRYSLRSIWMFAPFIRHIYIVTADQRPSWLTDHPRVTVVPHTAIFPDSSVLPTFNSHAIEACLHRIDGLSEDFLYFNDDMLLGRETNESDFFSIAGLAKARMSPSQFIYDGQPNASAIPTDWAAYNSVQLLERDHSIHFNRRMMHVPYPLKRSVMQEIEERYPNEVARTRAARFRATTDIAIPSMFGQYYAIATSRATEWKPAKNEYIYLDTGRATSYARYERILTKRPKFFCLNATRYDEVGLETQAAYLKEFLSGAFPVAAPWEADLTTAVPGEI